MSTRTVPQVTIGELVDVQIRGARIKLPYYEGHTGDTFMMVQAGGDEFPLPLRNSAMTVERVAPAQWPPQVGDIWADRDGSEWVAGATDGETIVMWRLGVRGTDDALDVLANHGPMTLLRRRGWTPATETTPAEAGPVDERAELVAGYRALADIIETHPELTDLPRYVSWQPTPEQQDAWVEALGGATRSDHPHEQTIQHWAKTKLRGLNLDVTWIEDLPATQPDEPVEDEPADADPEAPVLAPAAAPSIDDDAFDATCGPMPPAGRLFEGALKSPVEWLTEYPGTQILDWDGWHDKDVTEPISHAEFHQRLMQCTITGPAKLPHRTPDPDAASLLAESLADGAA